jgi:hypothetical protein
MASMEKQMTKPIHHTDEIIKAALVVSNLLGDMVDIYENHSENNEDVYDAMDALWFAIEAYKVASAHERLVANGEA